MSEAMRIAVNSCSKETVLANELVNGSLEAYKGFFDLVDINTKETCSCSHC